MVLEPSDEGGYSVLVPSLPGGIGEGDNREEVLTNIREAIALHLDPIENALDSDTSGQYAAVCAGDR